MVCTSLQVQVIWSSAHKVRRLSHIQDDDLVLEKQARTACQPLDLLRTLDFSDEDCANPA
jgi:hypothetical protein